MQCHEVFDDMGDVCHGGCIVIDDACHGGCIVVRMLVMEDAFS